MTRPIRTTFEHPPIPDRRFDWAAVFDDEYDGAPDAGPQLVGRGATEAEAVADLLEQAADLAELAEMEGRR
jgi:hypothetical protein